MRSPSQRAATAPSSTFPLAWTGVGRYDPVQRWQTAQLRVEFARPLTVVLDGELIADVSALTASCSPAALTCQIRAR